MKALMLAAAILASGVFVVPSAASADQIPPIFSAEKCDAGRLGSSEADPNRGFVCFDYHGNVTAHAYFVEAKPGDLARCRSIIIRDEKERPTACAAAGGDLIITGGAFVQVSKARLDAVGSDGVCIGKPMGGGKVDSPVACFTRNGDLLVLGGYSEGR
jgi:hypothetical protein